MKTVEEWRWRVKWTGRWRTTTYHTTEEAIRREHPEAVAVLGTRRVSTVPETPEEALACLPPTVQRPMDPLIASAWSMRRRPDRSG